MEIRPTLALGAFAVLWGCTGAPPPPPAPSIDAREVAVLQEQATRLERPTRVVFTWEANESGARFSGRGVSRFEPPYRARLDLFLGNGELAVQAALVDDELRLPPGAPEGLIPPAPLLWASLGVFRPGQLPRLAGGEALDSQTVRLRYDVPGARELAFRFEAGHLASAEIQRQGRTEERLEVTREGEGLPRSATYRNIAAFRELHVEVESIEYVESFPPEIWTLAR
ncbi:MAG: hypothetical protein R3E10_02395 [Gemmatimonadota bacterium]